MLVIADQRAALIGRQSGLARAGEAEEHRRIAIRANIGGAVHRHDALLGEEVVEDREDRLLHLASIGRAADQNELLRKVHGNDRLAARAMTRRISLEAGQIDDRIFRNEISQIGRFRTHKQGADEEIMPGELIDHADFHAIFRLRATEQIGDVKRALLAKRREEIFLQRCKLFRRHRTIDVPPPDGIFRLGIAHDELVLGGTAGVLTRGHHEGTILGEQAFPFAHRIFRKRRGQQVPFHSRVGPNTLIIQSKGRSSLHADLLILKYRPLVFGSFDC